jgi:hypothetical protein
MVERVRLQVLIEGAEVVEPILEDEQMPLITSNFTQYVVYYLYFRLARFSDVMTMLKEEKPLYLAFNTDNQVGYIGTSNEPVGEQEGH